MDLDNFVLAWNDRWNLPSPKGGEGTYWTACETCKRPALSRKPIVCHRCQTGAEKPVTDEVLFHLGVRAIRRSDVAYINSTQKGFTTVVLHNGEQIAISLGS